MKNLFPKALRYFVLVITISMELSSYSQVLPEGVIYVSPKTNTYYNHQSTNIIIKFNNPVYGEINFNNLISVNTAESNIFFIATLIENGSVLIIDPVSILPCDVNITVTLKKQLLQVNGGTVKPFSFSFYTTKNISSQFVNTELTISNKNSTSSSNLSSAARKTFGLKSVSSDLLAQLKIIPSTNNQPNKAYYFISTIVYNNFPNRCMILDNTGKVIYERFTKGYNLDFKMLTDTLVSYYDWNNNVYYIISVSLRTNIVL